MTAARLQHLVSIDCDRAALDRIARPGVGLAIWWRTLDRPMRAALTALDLSAVHDVSIDIDAAGSVGAALRSAGYVAVLESLAADVDLLVRRHAALTGEDRLRVGLMVAEDGRMDFGVDAGTLRLTCTYVGPGVQWCCVEGQDAICEIPTGAVGVFKGQALLDPPVVLRRAPPRCGRRLVLTIDPA